MSFSVYLGTAASPSGAQNVDYHDCGFQPKAIIFLGQLAVGTSDWPHAFIGFSSGTSNNHSVGTAFDKTNEHNCKYRDTSVVLQYWPAITDSLERKAVVSQIYSDGFQLQWTTSSGVANYKYIALGGTDLTNAYAGYVDVGTDTGTQAVSGVGFDPDLILFASGPTGTGTGSSGYGGISFGFAKSSTSRRSLSLYSEEVSTSNESSAQSNEYITMRNTSSSGYDMQLDISAMSNGGDGFVIARDDPPPETRRIIFLALKGLNSYIGTLTQPTSNGTQDSDSLGFAPSLALFTSACMTANGAQDHSKYVIGSATSSSSRFSYSIYLKDNVDTWVNKYKGWSDKCIGYYEESADVVYADFSSMGADKFTVNWGLTDSTQRQFYYLALGGTESATPITKTPSDDIGLYYSIVQQG